jgi:putative copper export protein
MEIIFHCMPLWIELISIAFCTGTLVFLLWVIPVAAYPDSGLRNRLWLLFIISVAVGMTGSVIDLILRIAEMSGETVLSSFPLVPSVLLKTHSGRVWLIRIVCLLFILFTSKIREIRFTPQLLIVLFCLDAVIALTESASGHAADKGDFSIAEIMDWIHLFGALMWVGGIFVLSFLVLPEVSELSKQAFHALAGQVVSFSRVAGIAVLFVVLTALYNVVIYVGSIKALMSTSYGLTILTKIALLVLLLLLAAYNRYISVPNLGKRGGLNAAKVSFISPLV